MTISRTRTYQLTNPHNFVTITANNTAEMVGLESKYDRLECDEFRFLKEISGIDIDIAFKISFIPEFVEALKDFDGELDSDTVYEVLKTVSNQMIKDGKMYKNARRTMNYVSKFVKGESGSWSGLKIDPNEDLGFLCRCTSIKPVTISLISLVPEYVVALKEHDGRLNDEAVYRILKSKFNDMLSNGQAYRTARKVINRVSKDVTGNSTSWQN